jgi:hypothetical protein
MLMVFVQGWPHIGATPKHLNLEEVNMETDDKMPFKLKTDYLKLSLKIYKMRCHGEEPPNELLQQAYNLGRLIGVSEEELKNL